MNFNFKYTFKFGKKVNIVLNFWRQILSKLFDFYKTVNMYFSIHIELYYVFNYDVFLIIENNSFFDENMLKISFILNLKFKIS